MNALLNWKLPTSHYAIFEKTKFGMLRFLLTNRPGFKKFDPRRVFRGWGNFSGRENNTPKSGQQVLFCMQRPSACASFRLKNYHNYVLPTMPKLGTTFTLLWSKLDLKTMHTITRYDFLGSLCGVYCMEVRSLLGVYWMEGLSLCGVYWTEGQSLLLISPSF